MMRPVTIALLPANFFTLHALRYVLRSEEEYEISVILRIHRRPTDDRPLFLEEPSWKNFKRPYLHNDA